MYNAPIEINSTYAFNIKNRDFKIKKYINYRVRSGVKKPNMQVVVPDLNQPDEIKEQMIEESPDKVYGENDIAG